MNTNKIITLNTFEDIKNLDVNNKSSVVFCSLSFCQPCKVIYPKFEEFSKYGAFKDVNFCKITMDELEDDNDESEIKSILNLEGKKYPQIVFLQNSQVLYQLESSNFEQEFQNIMLLFI